MRYNYRIKEMELKQKIQNEFVIFFHFSSTILMTGVHIQLTAVFYKTTIGTRFSPPSVQTAFVKT